MTELEKAEKLREKANVSFAEAKDALEHSGGDILDALIYLENQGKTTIPAGGGFFSGCGVPATQQHNTEGGERSSHTGGESLGDVIRMLGRFIMSMLEKGVTNYLEATKGGNLLFSCPVLAAVALVLFFFWITVPLFVVSLFFGFRYRFRGPDLGRDPFNQVMDNATNMADEVKKTFSEGTKSERNGH
jgi:hypothetical protein